jgi:hypothetical protein
MRVGGDTMAARTVSSSARRLVLRPAEERGRGAYRVQWHSVSTEDGHALEGSFSFGVRTAAAGAGHSLQQSPLARGGWLRVGARLLLYVALLLFTGALVLAVVLGRPWDSWLTAGVADRVSGVSLEAVGRRERAIVADLGVYAVGAGALSALLEGVDAAQGLSPAGLHDFLLTNAAGTGRLVARATRTAPSECRHDHAHGRSPGERGRVISPLSERPVTTRATGRSREAPTGATRGPRPAAPRRAERHRAMLYYAMSSMPAFARATPGSPAPAREPWAAEPAETLGRIPRPTAPPSASLGLGSRARDRLLASGPHRRGDVDRGAR